MDYISENGQRDRNTNVSMFSFTLHNQDHDTKFTCKVRKFAGSCEDLHLQLRSV